MNKVKSKFSEKLIREYEDFMFTALETKAPEGLLQRHLDEFVTKGWVQIIQEPEMPPMYQLTPAGYKQREAGAAHQSEQFVLDIIAMATE